MSKVVSSKFGDRQLIHLPAVSYDRDRTPVVPSLVPRGYDDYRPADSAYNSQSRRGTNQSYRDYRRNQTANAIPKEYAYQGYSGRTPNTAGNQLPGQQYNGHHGNIVPNPDMLPRQQYDGTAGQPAMMNYTPQAVAQMQPMQQPMPGQMMPGQMMPGQMMPGQTMPGQQPAIPGQPVMPMAGQQMPAQMVPGQVPYQPQVPVSYASQPPPGANPNEKHIYYGPNGEILPGPPIYGQMNGGQMIGGPMNGGPDAGFPLNFSVDGVLEYGVLKTISLSDGTSTFPKFPHFLTAQLRQKYGQFEKTNVKIVSTNGEIHIHATPHIPGGHGPPVQTPQEYIPQRRGPSSSRRYGTPAQMERSYPFMGHDHAGYRGHFEDQYRDDGEDAISELRWRKDDE